MHTYIRTYELIRMAVFLLSKQATVVLVQWDVLWMWQCDLTLFIRPSNLVLAFDSKLKNQILTRPPNCQLKSRKKEKNTNTNCLDFIFSISYLMAGVTMATPVTFAMQWIFTIFYQHPSRKSRKSTTWQGERAFDFVFNTVLISYKTMLYRVIYICRWMCMKYLDIYHMYI